MGQKVIVYGRRGAEAEIGALATDLAALFGSHRDDFVHNLPTVREVLAERCYRKSEASDIR